MAPIHAISAAALSVGLVLSTRIGDDELGSDALRVNATEPVPYGEIPDPGKACWGACRNRGWCENHCGENGACCRRDFAKGPPECKKNNLGTSGHHGCVFSPKGPDTSEFMKYDAIQDTTECKKQCWNHKCADVGEGWINFGDVPDHLGGKKCCGWSRWGITHEGSEQCQWCCPPKDAPKKKKTEDPNDFDVVAPEVQRKGWKPNFNIQAPAMPNLPDLPGFGGPGQGAKAGAQGAAKEKQKEADEKQKEADTCVAGLADLQKALDKCNSNLLDKIGSFFGGNPCKKQEAAFNEEKAKCNMEQSQAEQKKADSDEAGTAAAAQGPGNAAPMTPEDKAILEQAKKRVEEKHAALAGPAGANSAKDAPASVIAAAEKTAEAAKAAGMSDADAEQLKGDIASKAASGCGGGTQKKEAPSGGSKKKVHDDAVAAAKSAGLDDAAAETVAKAASDAAPCGSS